MITFCLLAAGVVTHTTLVKSGVLCIARTWSSKAIYKINIPVMLLVRIQLYLQTAAWRSISVEENAVQVAGTVRGVVYFLYAVASLMG